MRKITVIFFVCGICLTGCTQNNKPDFVPATNPQIQYIGRFDFSHKEAPVFMYSGCSIKTAFNGTAISLRLKDDNLKNWFTVKLDDSLFIFPSNKMEGAYQLAQGLTDKKHTIEISRRTEWHAGNTTFLGFEIDKGKQLVPAEKQSRAIEFIGDSYICGYGNEGKSNQEHFSYETEDNYLTYSAVTARELKADYVAVCRSGIGMYQGYGGDKSFNLPAVYDEVVVNSKAVYDYKNNQPQVVVVALGGNDLSVPLDSTAFVNTYIQFVQKIRQQCPAAKIICVTGHSSPGGKFEKFQTHVKAVVNYLKNIDKNIYYFAFTPFDAHGSDWHPNVKEHQLMANELIPFIKRIAQW